MAKGESLGEFEQLVLLAILRAGENAYGMRVRREIAERTSREVTIGAVYATLDRLVKKRLVTATVGAATPERGGRAKRSFRVTGAGMEALDRARQELASMFEGLSLPLRGGAG